jgi:tetratricopeptide (TPR) repeat protein
MRPLRRDVLLGLLLTLAVGSFAGGRIALERVRERELARLVPSLDRDLVHHIVADTDRDWIAYSRRIGTGPLGDAIQALAQELRTASYPEFLERRAPLEQAHLRIARGLSQGFDFPSPEMRARQDMARSSRADFHERRLEQRYIEISSDASRSAEERIHIVDDLTAQFYANGDPARAIYASLLAMQYELELGRLDRHQARLEAALQSARRFGDPYILCQLLGELGVVHENAGHEDSMRACFDEGIVTALRHGFVEHAARLLTFYASHYADHGRLALAFDRLSEAQRLCQGPGGESARLRLQVEFTKFVADLGCWDLVDRSLRRLPPLMRELPRSGRPSDVLKYRFDADRLRARLAFATGRADEGARLMEGLANSVPPAHRRIGYGELFDEWSAGLEASSRTAEALAICERGLAHCDTAHVPERAIPMLLRKARVLDQLGRCAEAGRALDSVATIRTTALSDDGRSQREVEVLRARLSLHQGRRDEAKRRIEEVFANYRSQLRRADAGSLNYLELDEARSLHDAMHEIERFSPEMGYRFELAWRSLACEVGRGRKFSGGPAWTRSGPVPRAAGWTHLVLWFTGGSLIRWTANSSGVVVDTLPMSASQCLVEVREALELLQTEPAVAGGVMGSKTLARLRRLSAILLPPHLAVADGMAHLDVSPDGPLLALPFEALPALGPRGEEPLALWADVAYVRGSNGSAPGHGPVVVVSNPSLPTDLAHRYGWVRSLPGSEAEAQAALARWPDAILLSGDQATKSSIRARWPGASIIYLAAHNVRDPDAPFLGFVPLAAPAGAPPDASLLEIADVHSLDLSACRLAVLASCSSGAAYRSAIRPGPSLADAFLDSGAGAVVRSFWDVGDAESRFFMKSFLSTWREDGDDGAALGRARRQVMATPEGASPRVWAAWSVETTTR